MLEIIDVGCNLKQFDGLLIGPDPQRAILRRIYATVDRLQHSTSRIATEIEVKVEEHGK